MFGYDFMVDQDLNSWLIEVNASPSMEYSTHVTETLVKEVLPEVVRIIIEGDNGKECLDGPDSTGSWVRVYNE